MSRRVFIADIIAATARVFGMTVRDITGPGRFKDRVLARQAGMFIAGELSGQSTPEIGRRFGGRDHSTVFHAYDKCRVNMDADATYRAKVEKVRAIVLEGPVMQEADREAERQRRAVLEAIKTHERKVEAKILREKLSDESELDDDDLLSARVAAYLERGGSFVETWR